MSTTQTPLNVFAGRPRHGVRISIRHFLILAALAVLPIACNSPRPASPPSQHALELNDGRKWVMPEPMMAHLRNIETDLQAFDATPQRDHVALAASIQENLGKLVTSCTMEGKAHDALHKWLMPLLGLSAEYTKATDPGAQQELLNQIKQSFRVFHDYFA